MDENEVKQEQAQTAQPTQTAQPAQTAQVQTQLPKVEMPTAQTALEENDKDSPAYAQMQVNATKAQIEQAQANKATEDEKAKKEQKKKQWIQSIGDAISGMANIVATTQGAPSAKIVSGSEKLNADFQKQQANSQKAYETFMNGLNKQLAGDKDALKSAWRLQYRKERAKAQDAQSDADRALKEREIARKENADNAKLPKINADVALTKEKVNTEKAKQGTERSKQGLNSARANKVGKSSSGKSSSGKSSSGKSSSGGYTIYDNDGNAVGAVKTPKEAIAMASEYGYSLTTSPDQFTGANRSTDDIVSQIGAESAKRKANKRK
jgi:hypothetical protein